LTGVSWLLLRAEVVFEELLYLGVKAFFFHGLYSEPFVVLSRPFMLMLRVIFRL
jgi:hypothetical protein